MTNGVAAPEARGGAAVAAFASAFAAYATDASASVGGATILFLLFDAPNAVDFIDSCVLSLLLLLFLSVLCM